MTKLLVRVVFERFKRQIGLVEKCWEKWRFLEE
jgi:hypothetical protein